MLKQVQRDEGCVTAEPPTANSRIPFERTAMTLRIAAAIAFAAISGIARGADAQHPTVIELFQSQGCSSCPPANANVNALAARPDILALSFAVTYWDGLGWKDVFARPQFTARQWDYARALGHQQVWTPQIIVNGRADIVGTQRAPLEALIARTGRQGSGPVVEFAAGNVGVSGTTTTAADVWLVRYDPRAVEVAIKAGENSGRTLPHRNIVHELIRIGSWKGGAARFVVPPAKSAGLATAAFVQAGPGGQILAAVRG